MDNVDKWFEYVPIEGQWRLHPLGYFQYYEKGKWKYAGKDINDKLSKFYKINKYNPENKT